MKTNSCTIFFVRHGESEANVKNLVGITKCHLSSKGKKQAEILNKNLEGVNFETIYSSEFERAKETAEIIAHGREVKIDGRLNEWNIGRLDGVGQSEFDQETNVYFDKNNKLGDSERFITRLYPEMETPKEVSERMSLFIKEKAQRYPGKNILAVTHAAALGFLLIQHKRLKFEQMPIFGKMIPNTSYIRILSDGDTIELVK